MSVVVLPLELGRSARNCVRSDHSPQGLWIFQLRWPRLTKIHDTSDENWVHGSIDRLHLIFIAWSYCEYKVKRTALLLKSTHLYTKHSMFFGRKHGVIKNYSSSLREYRYSTLVHEIVTEKHICPCTPRPIEPRLPLFYNPFSFSCWSTEWFLYYAELCVASR